MPREQLAFPRLLTASQKALSPIESCIVRQSIDIERWFQQQWALTPAPITSSVDLRPADFKLAPVDTNLFPAGFNNVQEQAWPLCAAALRVVLLEVQPDCQRVLLIPESHTRNVYYLQSLSMLRNRLLDAGFEVRIGSLDPDLIQPVEYTLEHHMPLVFEPLIKQDDRLCLHDFDPCVLFLNNDLSLGIPTILEHVAQPLVPSSQLGWSSRLKSNHFAFYNDVVNDFSQQFALDAWLLNPFFRVVHDVDFMQQTGLDVLASEVDQLLSQIKLKYQEHGIQDRPFVVVKADNGTYGMSVMMVYEGHEVLHLNRKQRTRMASRKGSQTVHRLLLQEGIYSVEVMRDQAVAEPVVYLIGPFVVSCFYRVHHDRGTNENLNTPGMSFTPLEFDIPPQEPYEQVRAVVSTNRFYVYGVVARLAALAAGREMAQLRSLA